jgi:hypothetical protein
VELTSRQPQCSNQQWSAPCQQALEIHAQHQASIVAQNASVVPQCGSAPRGVRPGVSTRSNRRPFRAGHMSEVPTIYMYSRESHA